MKGLLLLPTQVYSIYKVKKKKKGYIYNLHVTVLDRYYSTTKPREYKKRRILVMHVYLYIHGYIGRTTMAHRL